jgi:hypothetical protein
LESLYSDLCSEVREPTNSLHEAEASEEEVPEEEELEEDE